MLVNDIAKFDQSSIRTVEDMRTFLGAAYTMGHLLCPDFYSIREGFFIIIECDGYNWKKLSFDTRKRLWREVLAFYPFQACKIKYFHTGVFANLAVSLMRKILPSRVFEKIQVGCQFPDGRLDAFYALPTREAANKRLLRRIAQVLQTRFQHQKDFRLEPQRTV